MKHVIEKLTEARATAKAIRSDDPSVGRLGTAVIAIVDMLIAAVSENEIVIDVNDDLAPSRGGILNQRLGAIETKLGSLEHSRVEIVEWQVGPGETALERLEAFLALPDSEAALTTLALLNRAIEGNRRGIDSLGAEIAGVSSVANRVVDLERRLSTLERAEPVEATLEVTADEALAPRLEALEERLAALELPGEDVDEARVRLDDLDERLSKLETYVPGGDEEVVGLPSIPFGIADTDS